MATVVARRRVLRAVAGMGGALAGAAVLGGCGTAGSVTRSKAQPQPSAGAVRLSFNCNWQGAPWNATAVRLVQDYVNTHFNAKQRKIWATVTGSNGQGQAQTVIAASIAGTGFPAIVEDCCSDLATYESGKWLLPLNTFLRQDNISTALWNQGHIQALSLGGNLLALPSYDGPMVMMYRQDILDQIGLSYPHPNWTYTEAQALWQQCARKASGGKSRYGAALEWLPSPEYLFQGWGGTLMDAAHTRCLIDSPQCVAAGNWFYQQIFSGAATYRNDVSGLVSGREVFSMCGGWDVLPAAQQLGSTVKWNILPVPAWPKGFSTFTNIDFYGIDRAVRHPDAAWQLLRFLCVDPGFTRFQMQSTLVQPALLSLWSEWETVVKQTAVPLKTKHLKYFKEAALSGRAYPHMFFLNGAVQADQIIASGASQIASHKVSVSRGFAQIARQVNAWEKNAATAAANAVKIAAAMKKNYPTHGPSVAVVQPGL